MWNNNQNILETVENKLIDFFKTSSPKELKALGNLNYPDCGHGGGIYRVMLEIINESEPTEPIKAQKKGKVTRIPA